MPFGYIDPVQFGNLKAPTIIDNPKLTQKQHGVLKVDRVHFVRVGGTNREFDHCRGRSHSDIFWLSTLSSI
jgi:hypothetical protein